MRDRHWNIEVSLGDYVLCLTMFVIINNEKRYSPPLELYVNDLLDPQIQLYCEV